jgi:hypothetical protein
VLLAVCISACQGTLHKDLWYELPGTYEEVPMNLELHLHLQPRLVPVRWTAHAS